MTPDVPVPLPAAPPAAPSAGVFLALEGGDGAGKSTQVQLLRERIEALGREVVVTREPGGTPLGAQVRRLLLHGGHVGPRAEALLFAADRAHHVDTLVRPALARGAVVITDRYLDSSVAYQGAGRALPADDVRSLSLWAVEGLVPTLTAVLDVPAALGRERRGAVHDRLESEADTFHEAVRAGFLRLAAAEPARYVVVDAALAPQAIHERLWERVAPLLAAGAPAPGGGA